MKLLNVHGYLDILKYKCLILTVLFTVSNPCFTFEIDFLISESQIRPKLKLQPRPPRRAKTIHSRSEEKRIDQNDETKLRNSDQNVESKLRN